MKKTPRLSVAFLSVALLLVLSFATRNATAQNNFDFRLGESVELLVADELMEDGNEAEIQRLFGMTHSNLEMDVACYDPLTRARFRDSFSVLVENTSSVNALTSISIDLTAAGYEFGSGDRSGDGFSAGDFILNPGMSSSGVTMTARRGSDSSEIVIDFSGLENNGDYAVFRLDLDPINDIEGVRPADYRELLLGANENSFALLDVKFSGGSNFTNFQMDAGDFDYEINPRRFEAYHGGSMPGRLGPNGDRTRFEGNVTIPEPSTLALTLLSVLAAGLCSTRK